MSDSELFREWLTHSIRLHPYHHNQAPRKDTGMNLSKLLPPKIMEAIAALVGVGLTYATAHYGAANTWVQLAVAAAAVLGVGTVANMDALSARRAAKAAAKTAAKAA